MSTKRKVYLASSWRNKYQPGVLEILRHHGHEVYDFRNPGPEDVGFGWSQIDPEWKDWKPAQLKEALKHPIAQKGHHNDHSAMEWADTGILLLPSGNSAHLEAGWLAGQGKPVCVLAPEMREPDLMYLSLTAKTEEKQTVSMFCLTMEDVLSYLDGII